MKLPIVSYRGKGPFSTPPILVCYATPNQATAVWEFIIWEIFNFIDAKAINGVALDWKNKNVRTLIKIFRQACKFWHQIVTERVKNDWTLTKDEL